MLADESLGENLETQKKKKKNLTIQRKSSFSSLRDTADSSVAQNGPLPAAIQPPEESPRSAGAAFPTSFQQRRRLRSSGGSGSSTSASGSGYTRDKEQRQKSAFAQLFPWSMAASSNRLPTTTTTITQRSESMAYPSSAMQNFLSKLQYYARRHNQVLMVGFALFIFVAVLSSSSSSSDAAFPSGSVSVLRGSSSGGAVHFGGAARLGYFFPQDSINKKENYFHFAAVTDLDQLSRVQEEEKPTFRSVLVPGKLIQLDKNRYQIDQDEPREVRTKHNEAGRGAEFSELTLYQNRLYTFDDRTGDVFEILNKDGGTESFVVPRFVITEGEGETDKGMKWEWATVKNGELVVGFVFQMHEWHF